MLQNQVFESNNKKIMVMSKIYELTVSLASSFSVQPFIAYGSLTKTHMAESKHLALNLSMDPWSKHMLLWKKSRVSSKRRCHKLMFHLFLTCKVICVTFQLIKHFKFTKLPSFENFGQMMYIKILKKMKTTNYEKLYIVKSKLLKIYI